MRLAGRKLTSSQKYILFINSLWFTEFFAVCIPVLSRSSNVSSHLDLEGHTSKGTEINFFLVRKIQRHCVRCQVVYLRKKYGNLLVLKVRD